MFNKKSVLFIILLLTLSMLVVACSEDDEKLIRQSLDTLVEGIEEGDAEKIESVLAEEVYDVLFDETLTRAELAEEMSMLAADITYFAPAGVEFVVEFRDRTLKDFTEDTVTVRTDVYLGTIMPTELMIKDLEYFQSFYEFEELEQAIEALKDGDTDRATEYLLATEIFSEDDVQRFITGEQGEVEEIEFALVKEDGKWYINSINE